MKDILHERTPITAEDIQRIARVLNFKASGLEPAREIERKWSRAFDEINRLASNEGKAAVLRLHQKAMMEAIYGDKECPAVESPQGIADRHEATIIHLRETCGKLCQEAAPIAAGLFKQLSKELEPYIETLEQSETTDAKKWGVKFVPSNTLKFLRDASLKIAARWNVDDQPEINVGGRPRYMFWGLID